MIDERYIKQKNIANLYDCVAADYNEGVARTNYIGPHWLLQNASIDLKERPQDVLDLGCANGINIRNLKKINPELMATGVDISPKMIQEARKTHLYQELHCRGLDEKLPSLKQQSFSIVLALGFLEFILDIDQALQEISRVSAPGAELYASFQHYNPKNDKAPRRSRSGEVIHNAYSEYEVRQMLKKNQWELKSLESVIGYIGNFPCPYIMVRALKL